jgi:hypothetical protein
MLALENESPLLLLLSMEFGFGFEVDSWVIDFSMALFWGTSFKNPTTTTTTLGTFTPVNSEIYIKKWPLKVVTISTRLKNRIDDDPNAG